MKGSADFLVAELLRKMQLRPQRMGGSHDLLVNPSANKKTPPSWMKILIIRTHKAAQLTCFVVIVCEGSHWNPEGRSRKHPQSGNGLRVARFHGRKVDPL